MSSGGANILKEFLVALGFKIDQAGAARFNNMAKAAELGVIALGAAATAAAAAVVAGVVKMSDRFEDLYYLSQRVGSSASNISAYGYALSQVGGSADKAKASIEAISNFIKFNPGGERFLSGLGIQTRDAAGGLRDTTDIVRDLAKQLRGMPLAKANVIASTLGIDSQTLQIMMRDNDAFFDSYKKHLAEMGVDQEEAAEASHRLMVRLRELWAIVAIAADAFLIKLQPALQMAAEWILKLWNQFLVWRQGSGSFLNWDQWSPEFKALFSALGELIANIVGLGKLLWQYLGPAIIVLVHGGLKLMTDTLHVIADAIKLITDLLRGDWRAAWTDAKKFGADSLKFLVDTAMTLFKAVRKVWWAVFHHGQSPPGESQGGTGPAAPSTSPGAGTPGAGAPAATAGSTPAVPGGGSPAQRALAYFRSLGWTPAQAAGIVANLQAESGFNAKAVGDKGAAYGIGQWHADRQAAFKRWAGKDIRESTLAEQLAFVQFELTQGMEQFAGRKLRGATTARDAGGIVSKYYERPADTLGEMAKRAALAQALLDGSRLAGPGGTGVVMAQKTEINVYGSDPAATGRAVRSEQDQVNGQLVRNLKSAAA